MSVVNIDLTLTSNIDATMKRAVTLLAPVAPFRGGIAQHSEALALALADRDDIDLQVESFARLYPTWLYPGQSDRTADAPPARTYPVAYQLDTLNPLSWTRVAKRIAARGGIAIIPAWTFFVSPMLGQIARHLRAAGITVVVVVHNVTDHDSAGWKRALSRWQLTAADRYLTHTAQLAEQLTAQGLAADLLISPHPAYNHAPAASGTMPRERALELLCFGLVRHYKGVDIALRALALSGLQDVRLTIAGEVWDHGDRLRELMQDPALAGKVTLIDRYVTDQEAAELFARADAVLAPYRSVTGSGVVALARRYRRPLIASDLPGLGPLIRDQQLGWTFPPEDVDELAQLLANTVNRTTAATIAATILPDDEGQGWADFAAQALKGL